jgi:hypothetical protein
MGASADGQAFEKTASALKKLPEAYQDYVGLVGALAKSHPGAPWLGYWDDVVADLTNWLQRDALPSRPNLQARLLRRLAALKNSLWYKIQHSPNPARFPIWLLPLTQSHLKQMLPVAKSLRDRGLPPLFITGKKPLLKTLRREGFACLAIEDAPEGYFEMPFAAALKNLPEAQKLAAFWETRWPSLQKWERSLTRLFATAPPKLLVLGNDLLGYCRLAERLAQKKGIPIACIQHGSMNQLNPLYRHIRADRYFVFGENTFSELAQMGIAAERLCIAGAPAMQEIGGKRAIGFFPNGYALAMFSGIGHSTSAAHHRRIVRALEPLAKLLHPVALLVKLHPKESKTAYSSIQGQATVWGNEDLKTRSMDTLALIRGARFLVTGASTAAQEAMCFGVAVFTLDFEGEYPDADFIRAGATIHCQREEDFLEKTQTFLQNPLVFSAVLQRAKKFAAQTYFQPESQSPAQYIAAQMCEMAQSRA